MELTTPEMHNSYRTMSFMGEAKKMFSTKEKAVVGKENIVHVRGVIWISS